MNSEQRERLRLELQGRVFDTWRELAANHPALHHVPCPTVKLCGRMYRTAGWFTSDDWAITFGVRFFRHWIHSRYMRAIIVRHETAHAADMALNGKCDGPNGHGVPWQNLCEELGIPPERYHPLEVTR